MSYDTVWDIPVFFGLGADGRRGGRADQSVARRMNEECLEAIRRDFPAPTVHSRNLYHSSAAMYDAWAAYDPVAVFSDLTAVGERRFYRVVRVAP